MNLAQQIYQHSLNLPEVAAREALDFIEFLEIRYQSDYSVKHASLSSLVEPKSWKERVLAVAGTLSDDFPDDIDDSDLGEDVAREELD